MVPAGGPAPPALWALRLVPDVIRSEGGRVVWDMTPARARKIAQVLEDHTRAASEVARLRASADTADRD